MATSTRECARCGKNRQLRFFTRNGRVCITCRRGTRRVYDKNTRLQETYGITLDEWYAMLQAQGGVCAACGGKRRNYDVDHDHAVERALIADGMQPQLAARMSVRGLLCRRCNKVLRDVRDSRDALRGLGLYLAKPPAATVLGTHDH